MGQTLGIHTYRVSNPTTPYEYSKHDHIMHEECLYLHEERIERQLEADARYIETCLLNSRTGTVVLHDCDIVRVNLGEDVVIYPANRKSSHAMISRELRVKCLTKHMKIPFVLDAHDDKTIIRRVFNVAYPVSAC